MKYDSPTVYRSKPEVPVGFSASLEKMSREDLMRELVLRNRVEAKLRAEMSDQSRILQELEIHQLELELQNREVIENHGEFERLSRKYIELYDFAPVAYISLDKRGKILQLNITAARLLKTDRVKCLGKNFTSWLSKDQKPQFEYHLLQRQNSDENTLVCEVDLYDTTVHLHSALSFDEEKQQFIIRAAIIDVTDKKKAQVAEEKIFELREEKLLRDRFISSVTHDLRTPLASSKLCAQMLDGAMNDLEKRRKLYHMMIEELDRADNMIRELLDAHKESGGQTLPLIMKKCNLASITEKCVERTRELYPHVTLNYRSDGELTGVWSKDGLIRIIENLISNAIKYGSIEEAITVVVSGNEKSVTMIIHNYGEPIPQKEQKRIFDAFHRTTTAEKSEALGWGLGLSLVHNIVLRHKGTISVRSTISEGTSFIVELPKNA